MIDEVFILYDLYQVTNDYFGSMLAYDVWLSMHDF
jgi:hypothetical protein